MTVAYYHDHSKLIYMLRCSSKIQRCYTKSGGIRSYPKTVISDEHNK